MVAIGSRAQSTSHGSDLNTETQSFINTQWQAQSAVKCTQGMVKAMVANETDTERNNQHTHRLNETLRFIK